MCDPPDDDYDYDDASVGTEEDALPQAWTPEEVLAFEREHQNQAVFFRATPLPRVKVKASRPSMRGGWQCLLVCGCDVHEPTARRRPKAVDHVCPPEVE
jgi:hypothetical protein